GRERASGDEVLGGLAAQDARRAGARLLARGGEREEGDERARELERSARSLVAMPREGSLDELAHFVREIGTVRLERSAPPHEDGDHQVARRLRREGPREGQGLVEDHAERVDVDPLIEVDLRLELLGRHVPWRADHLPGAREALEIAQLGDAEVEELDLLATARAVREEDVLGLQIPVEDARGVRGLEADGGARDEGHDLLERERAAI